MIDNRPIGFFDSGVGGLTCIPHVVRMMPNESVIFYGDTARSPYGSKAPETILEFSEEIGEFLVNKDIKMLVIACNTATSVALHPLREKFNIPIVGCITPTVKQVINDFGSDDRIGIIATKATIKSGAYERKLSELAPDFNVFSKACPAFVPLIEEGIIEGEPIEAIIRYYLDDFIAENDINTLVLGCTHYPIIAGSIKKLYPNVKIKSSSKEVATAVKMDIEEMDMAAGDVVPTYRFYASDLSENFQNMVDKIAETAGGVLDIRFEDV